jgi:hypothetical protein
MQHLRKGSPLAVHDEYIRNSHYGLDVNERLIGEELVTYARSNCKYSKQMPRGSSCMYC